MTTPTLTLSDFLLARIAEDEEVARAAQDDSSEGRNRWWVDGPARESGKHWVYATGEKFTSSKIADHIARHDPARVLAECEAKRRNVDRLTASVAGDLAADPPVIGWTFEDASILRILAQPYADHEDFRDEWRI